MALETGSAVVEVKRGRGRPARVKGMVSPAMSQTGGVGTAPITPDCNPTESLTAPASPACAPSVRPRRLFGAADETRSESPCRSVRPYRKSVTPSKSSRGSPLRTVTPSKSSRGTPLRAATPSKSSRGTPLRAVTPSKSSRGCGAGTESARSTPKKAKAEERDFEAGDALEIRKSPRLARGARRSVSQTPKRSRGRPRKSLEPGRVKKAELRGRNPTRRSGGERLVEGEQVRRFVKKIVFEGVEYRVGDDVYVRRGVKDRGGDGVNGDEGECLDSDAEVEDCVLCGKSGEHTMIECDECLGGFHLRCLNPPLDEVPDGDWMCSTCEAVARGENVECPPRAKRTRRTARERLLAQELWASRIEKLWREKDGTMCFLGRWWSLPEETADGRQQWHGRRELFRSNHVDENEMETILRHCYVMTPDEYAKSGHEGDDVFMCGHEYDFRHQTFKRIADEFDEVSDVDDSDDESFDPARRRQQNDSDDDDVDALDDELEDEFRKPRGRSKSKSRSCPVTPKAANVRKGHVNRIEGVGAKLVPRARKRPLTDLEKAKAALGLSAAPTTLPCRDREKSEIEAFVKDAVAAGEDCLGRCLYISGVPGTGKTATVLEVMKGLRSKVDSGELPPYRFVEINGLRLPSPEHAYTVLHEALTGQHCGWRRALQHLDARFSDSKPLQGLHARPCILLVDELDLLVTRSQSVLYNLFDWPSRANSRLIVIGIANTMDLPERMLPRIASRLGLHRISFGPYSHTQLQQILATRLEGIPAFDKQAVEFASRKVAAVSGDARRALELCRRAAEITELRIKPVASSLAITEQAPPSLAEPPQTIPQTTSKLIGMSDVEAAIAEMFQAPHIQFMKRCSRYSKIFLVAMVIEQHRTSVVETTFEKIVTGFMRLCVTHNESCPGEDSILTVGCKLGASRLLLCEPAIRHRHQKLQLNFPCDDVQFALKDDKELPWLVKYL